MAFDKAEGVGGEVSSDKDKTPVLKKTSKINVDSIKSASIP